MTGPAPTWQRETQAGLTTALVLLPMHGTYGVIALGPLGSGFAATGFLLGVFAAILSNLLPVLLGDRGPLGTGPSASLSLLVPPLLLQLLATPVGADAGTVLALLGLAVALSGALQWVLGHLRWGGVVRYVPYPVYSGFMLGVSVLMVLSTLPYALGVPGAGNVRPAGWVAGLGATGLHPLAPLVALAAGLCVCALRRWRPRWPALLLGLLAGVLMHHALALAGAGVMLGAVLGPIQVAWPGGDLLQELRDPALWTVWPALAWPLGQFALATALTGALQALTAQSLVRSATGDRGDADALLRAQGLGGLAGGLLGLVPAGGSVSSTGVALSVGGRSTLSRVAHGLALLLLLPLLGLGPGLLQHLPMAAVAGVFLVVAWDLVDPWTRQTLGRLLRGRSPGDDAAAPVAVMALVAGTAVGVSLVAGVLVGTLASVLLFVRAQLRPPVRRVLRADQQPSRTLRPPAVAERLRPLARRIVCVTLDGHLFFGTADAAARAVEQAAAKADSVVLDCRHVREIDASGARVLLQLAASLRQAGCHLTLAAVALRAQRGLRLLDTQGLLPPERFFADADLALDAAENRALAAAGVLWSDEHPLPLAQTLLGQGLDAAALQRLQSVLQPLSLPAGQHVFRCGEAGEALYVVLAGQVAIVLPGRGGAASQRLVAFAPGAVFGEVGLLRGQARSADAVVERDAQLAQLGAAALQHLAQHAPAVHAQLLLALALHLADRLGALTMTLQALEDATPEAAADTATDWAGAPG